MFNDRGSPRGINEREQQRNQIRLAREARLAIQQQRAKTMERDQNKLNLATIIPAGNKFAIQLKYVNNRVTQTHPFTTEQLLKKGAGYLAYFDPESKTRFNQLKETQLKNSAALPATPVTLSPAASPRFQSISTASSSGFYSRANAPANSNWQVSGSPEQGRRAGAARPS
jgi:hypothetical protein